MYLTSVFFKMRLLFTILMLTSLWSCSSLKSLSPKEYLDWYSSTGFGWKGIDTIQDFTCAMRLFPKEADIAKCALQDCESKETLIERLQTKDETLDFIIEFTSLKLNTGIFDVPGSTGSSRTDRIMYFSSGIKNDIKGITNTGDTLICQSVLYEPSLPQKARILISLEDSKKSINQIMITDRAISGEIIRFYIPELSNKSIPTLKL